MEALRENDILVDGFQNREETKVPFQEQYFRDAVDEGHRQKKPILFIFGDFMIDEIKEILRDFFGDEEILKDLSKNFLVFGIERGSAEANSLSLEFGIKEIPFFATILCKSRENYDVIESYNDDEVEISKLKEFLERSRLTFDSLLDYLVQSNQYETTQEDEDQPLSPRGFVDIKQEEDRLLKEQQRMDFMKAQEDDRKMLEAKAKEEQKQRKEEEEKKEFEKTKKELAKRKKSELPPEPEEGTCTNPYLVYLISMCL